jgi:hypothetical protein
MGRVMADNIHVLDCHLQSLCTTVGKPRSIPGVMAGGNVWEALFVMGQDTQAPGLIWLPWMFKLISVSLLLC